MSIEDLRQVIRGRPVAILLPGPSIKQLEERIKELKDIDICYASVNDFWIMEENILSQIDKQCELVLCSAKECDVPSPRHLAYLQRKNHNIFFTEKASFHKGLPDYIEKFGDRLFFFTSDLYYGSLECPNSQQPFHFFGQASFVVLMCLSVIGGADTIILFGADGGSRKSEELYYRGWKSDSAFRLGYDTGVANITATKVIYQAAVTHKVEKYRIINCSPDTYYAPFPISNYDNTFKLLKEEYEGE